MNKSFIPLKISVILFGLLLIIVILFQACKTPSIIATQAIQKGDEMNNRQQYDEAIIHYEKYLEVAPSLGLYRNPSMEADVYRKLSHAYSTQANYQLSLKHLYSASKIDSTIPANKLELIEDYRKLGIIYGLIGNFNFGIQNLNRSLELNKGMEKSIKDEKKLSIADTYMSLAQIYYTIGNLALTKEYIYKSIDLYNKIPNEYLGQLEALLLLGKLTIETDKINEGITYINQSMKIAVDNELNTARHDQVLSRAMILKVNYEEALKYSLSALEKAEESKIISQIIWMNIKVGDVYEKLGDFKKSEAYFQKALNIKNFYGDETSAILPSVKMRLGDVQEAYDLLKNSGSDMGIAIATLKLGFLYSKNRKSENAKELYRKAQTLFKQIESKEGLTVTKIALAKELINTDSLQAATHLLEEAYKLSNHPENVWKLKFEEGRIFEKNGRIDSAYFAYKDAVKIIEEIRGSLSIDEFKSSYIEDKMFVYEKLIMLLLGSNEKVDFPGLKIATETEAFYFAERAKARSFLDLLGNTKLQPKEISDTFLLQKEYFLRFQIQKLSKELQKSDVGYYERNYMDDELKSLKAEYNETLQLIKLKNNNYKSLVSIEPPNIKQIQSSLNEKSAIIQYWLGKDELAIWFITKDKIKAKLINQNNDYFEELISKCRESIVPENTIESAKLLSQLYTDLIHPFEKQLTGYKSLLIIPHRSLHFLPFHSLINSENQFLAEKYFISYAPSAAVNYYCNSMVFQKGENFLGMALGNFPIGAFAGLPGTEMEIKQITSFYPMTTTTFLKETSESFLKKEGSNFNLLHIATHGILDEKLPMFSYLLLNSDNENDGQLTVNEIFGLNLKARLVTLSACETGLGEMSQGDELIGLSRAFIYAGAPAIIVSLWPVDDISTAFIMTKFYQYYSSGYPLNESLAYAQRNLLDSKLYKSNIRGLAPIKWEKNIIESIDSGSEAKKRNPFFWAPFILIGNNGN